MAHNILLFSHQTFCISLGRGGKYGIEHLWCALCMYVHLWFYSPERRACMFSKLQIRIQSKTSDRTRISTLSYSTLSTVCPALPLYLCSRNQNLELIWPIAHWLIICICFLLVNFWGVLFLSILFSQSPVSYRAKSLDQLSLVLHVKRGSNAAGIWESPS